MKILLALCLVSAVAAAPLSAKSAKELEILEGEHSQCIAGAAIM